MISKHLEFVGINGSGKSTLYRRCNAYLSRRIGYKPGPDKLWVRMVDDLSTQPPSLRNSRALRLASNLNQAERVLGRITTRSERTFSLLAKAMLAHTELLAAFLEGYSASMSVRSSTPAFSHWDLQYFLSLLAYRQARLECASEPVLLFDEGFVSALLETVCHEEKIDDAAFSLVFERHLQISKVFHLRCGVDTSLERLAKRGIPAPYAHMQSGELRDYLIAREAAIDRVCERLAEVGTTVVQIDTDGADDPFLQIQPYLDEANESAGNSGLTAAGV